MEKINFDKVEYVCLHIPKPTLSQTQLYYDVGLYDPNGLFRIWYRDPEWHFRDGVIIATAWDDCTPLAICLAKLQSRDGMPMMGFYTMPKYRRQGLSLALGELVSQQLDKLYGHGNYTVVADKGPNWGTGYALCEKLGHSVQQFF